MGMEHRVSLREKKAWAHVRVMMIRNDENRMTNRQIAVAKVKMEIAWRRLARRRSKSEMTPDIVQHECLPSSQDVWYLQRTFENRADSTLSVPAERIFAHDRG